MRGSSCWALSHQTVPFCFRMRATYEVGDMEELLREEVDLLTPLVVLWAELVGTR